MNLTTDYSNLSLGTVVSTPRRILGVPFKHVGVITSTLPVKVASASAADGRVVEESLTSFADGGIVRKAPINGELPTQVVVRRARNRLGKAYSLFSYNCEHFVRDVHGLEVRSPQVHAVIAPAFLIGLLYLTAR